MNRVLVFHGIDPKSQTRLGPTYYMDADYDPVAVRIYAETAPSADAVIDIFDDGVSIFSNQKSSLYNLTSGVRTDYNDKTTVQLPAGENSEVMAESFKPGLNIEQGSWIHCNLVEHGGGKNFTVQLELKEISEEGEYDGE